MASQLDYPSTKRAPRNAVAEEPRERSLAIGALCTVIFHVLLFVIAPLFPAESFTGSHSNLDTIAANRAKNFDIELAPGLEAPEKQPDPFRFVETNPDAPENEPDKTNNFSDRNQQSAQQEKPPEVDPENRPSVKGSDEIQGGAIVSGNRAPPQAGSPERSVEEAINELLPQDAQQARAEQIPLSGFEKIEGKSEDGVGSNISKHTSPSNNADRQLDGSRDSRNPQGGPVEQKQVTQQAPKQRPRLASISSARESPLSNRLAGTMNVGPVGIDARWSEFGQYMKEFIDIVDAEFQALTSEYRGHIPPGTRVVVTFTLNSQGEISISKIEETAGRVAVNQCQSAITNRMPYRKWSDQMISVLGREQTITFGFYYW